MMNDRMHRAKLLNKDRWLVDYYKPEWGNIVDLETLSRCSGVMDCKGNMVFEGDILAFYDENGEREYLAGVVRYGEFECDIYDIIGWWIDDGFENVFIPREISEIFYVVGNICDNPELVGKWRYSDE